MMYIFLSIAWNKQIETVSIMDFNYEELLRRTDQILKFSVCNVHRLVFKLYIYVCVIFLIKTCMNDLLRNAPTLHPCW